MRTVAVATLLALSFVLVTFPVTSATNECTTSTSTGQFCQAVPVAKPVPPPPAPGLPPQTDVYFDLYYLFVKPMACTSPTSHDCRGIPPAGGSGVPVPTGGAIGANVFAILFQETNNCGGLQRKAVGGCSSAGDRMILV